MDSFIGMILQRIKEDTQHPPPRWSFSPRIPPTHWKWIQKECQGDSEFDTLRLRQRVLEHPPTPTSYMYATSPYGSVIVCGEVTFSPREDIPWDLWGRILRLFHKKAPFTIYLLASATPRTFPPRSQPIRPQHINGGYTYPCRTDTIVIYRAEDATRVLIHELQHASCLDHPEKGVDDVEAETEAWAEVLYVTLLSKGDLSAWRRGWARQWRWIQQQNQQVARHMKRPDSTEFPWRYTLGKERVIRRWFSSLPAVSSASPSTSPSSSLRLATPPTIEQKREQGIRLSSTVL